MCLLPTFATMQIASSGFLWLHKVTRSGYPTAHLIHDVATELTSDTMITKVYKYRLARDRRLMDSRTTNEIGIMRTESPHPKWTGGYCIDLVITATRYYQMDGRLLTDAASR